MVQRASRVGLAFAVAAVATTGFLVSNAYATFPGADGRIAFVGDMPGCSGICTVHPDGSGLRLLSSFGSAPSWSANGRRIVFFGRWIHTMKADGTDRTKVPSTGGSSFPSAAFSAAFSPSGGRIVYNRYRANAPPRLRGVIYAIRADGTHKRLVFAGRHVPETPGYSPNGKRIVFSGKPNHRAWGIWTIRPDGGGLRPVTTDPNSYGVGSDHYPDWRPDGKKIAFLRYTDSDPRMPSGPVKFVRPDGSGIHATGASGGGARFLYSPSGDQLVSGALGGPYPYLSDCGDVFTEPVGGGERTIVTDNCATYENGGPTGFASNPSWQPLPGG